MDDEDATSRRPDVSELPALPPVLPGLAPRRRLGRGPDSPWMARTDDGRWVVVRRGRQPVGLPEHAAVLPVLGQVRDAAGEPWLMTPYRSGSGLDRRLERLGRVEPEQARAIGAAVSGALAALHQAGLAHGDLDPSRVLLGARDEAVVECSCARLGTPADFQEDLDRCVAMLDASTDLRATARPRHARARGLGRSAVVATALTALLLAAGVVGVRLADRPAPTATLAGPVPVAEQESVAATDPPTPSGSALPDAAPDAEATEARAEPDWLRILEDLDRARGAAFATADTTLLGAVDAPGSTALRRDTALIEALRDAGVVAEHWATRLLSVRPLNAGPDAAVLAVTDRMPGYVLRDDRGRVVDRHPPRASHDWRIRVVSTSDGWRIAWVR